MNGAIAKVVAAAVLLMGMAGVASAYPATVTTALNMRAGPGTGHAVILVLPRGATVQVRTCRSNWCEVTYRNRRGFVSQRYIATRRTPPSQPAPPPGAPPGPPPWTPPSPDGACDDRAAQWATGSPAVPPVVERARRDAGARTVRVVRPDEAVTMEFNPQRLTLDVDRADIITRVRCG